MFWTGCCIKKLKKAKIPCFNHTPLPLSIPVPLSDATLTVVPGPGDIFEGNTVYLICGVTGTPPVTFKWYRQGRGQLLFAGTTNEGTMDHQILDVNRDHSDKYYCEALNHARNLVRSQTVLMEGELPGRLGREYNTL